MLIMDSIYVNITLFTYRVASWTKLIISLTHKQSKCSYIGVQGCDLSLWNWIYKFMDLLVFSIPTTRPERMVDKYAQD